MDKERKHTFKNGRYNRRTIQMRWVIGILAVILIGGSYFLGMHAKSSQVKKETPITESKAEKTKQKNDTPVESDPRDLASFGHGTNVKQTNNDFSPEDIQNALDTGKPVVEKAISSTTELVNSIVKEQKEMKEAEQLRIKDFQKTVTQDVRDRVDAQVEMLNEAAQIAHMMAAGSYMAKNEDVPFTNAENVIAEKLETLSQNLIDMAYSLETYTVAKSFETWNEAESYLPNREEKSLLAIPINEAIFNSSSIIDQPVIAEPVTEQGNTNNESAIADQTDAEKYPEAITSVFKISEAMNAIYVEADELQKKFTPYKKKDGFSQFEYISVDDLKDLYKFDATIANEITASTHFEAPDYTTNGFTQAMESHRIIIKELDQLSLLLEDYPEDFQKDPDGTLMKAKSHFERIKDTAQTKLLGFEKFFETAGPEAN